MNLRRTVCWLIVAIIFPSIFTAQSDDLISRIWMGEQQAQAKFTTACGTVMEVRTSHLMVKPLVLHGKFCAKGMDRFMLEYLEPHPMRVRLNENYLNLQGANGKTQVMNIGRDIHRVQSSFIGKNSMESLQKNFIVTARESTLFYEMRLVPRAERLRHRFNYLEVKLNKRDFLPRSLEVDGKNGVNSVFTFDITSTGKKIPKDTFEVVKKK